MENLAQLVAIGHTIKDAAEGIGIPEQAAYKLSRLGEFKQRVSGIRTERTEGLAAQALGLAEKAFGNIENLMDTAKNEAVKLKANLAMIEKVHTLAELSELRRRLDDLERGAAEEAGET